jgi:hypothetical protein
MSQKKVYAMYVKRFERFLCRVAELYLKLAKRYLPDDYLVRAVGKREAINLSEFRRIADEGFNIKLKPMTNDIDSMFGKHLSIQTALQYGSSDMPMSAKGKLLRSMPFLGEDSLFGELTITDENIESDILALDRGEYRPALPTDEHPIYIKRLNHRTKQNDFRLLPPEIQQMYSQKIQQHTEAESEQLRKMKEMQADYWPTGGGLVKVDLYGKDGKRMLMPQESLQKLVQVLEQQGTQQEILQQLDQQNQLQVLQAASNMPQNQQMPPAQPEAAGPGLLSQQPA